jgi:hypothetical protein
MRKPERLVRYVSPFGSPAWMTRERAQEYLEDDDKRWLMYGDLDLLSEEQRRVGAPRIEASS